MSQEALLLLVVAVTGIYAVNWARRLAPLGTELPLKTLTATLLAGVVAAAGFGGTTLSQGLVLLALVVGPLFVFGPLALIGLARARRYRLAGLIAQLLYWTPAGRAAVNRILAQAALQQGDAEAALRAIPDADPLMLAQAYALQGEWGRVLELELPTGSDNAFLGDAARIQALISLGRLGEAEHAIGAMRERWQAQGQGPIGFRSVALSEARLAAERGAFEAVRERFREPLPGVPAYLLFGILGRAAERAQRLEPALELYAQAYSLAPPQQREDFAAKLRAHQKPIPSSRVQSRPYGTYALAAALVVAYLVQVWLDARFGRNFGAVVAGFLVNNPTVPASDASWRFLSYAFVHGGLVHIGFNVWVLLDLGRLYEARRGWGNLLAAFVLGTIMGAYITTLAQPQLSVPLVGASGGVLGIAGALLADALRGRAPADRMLTQSLLRWMALIVLFSVAIPNVSLWGHVGGVVGGLLWGFVRQGLPLGRRLDLFAGGVGLGLMAYTLLQVADLVVRLAF